jgi:hypothetical protein
MLLGVQESVRERIPTLPIKLPLWELESQWTPEFFNERIELEFIPKNFDYISRCKLCDLVNATNDNLRQYVRAYSKLMLEIQHMHELDHVCHFVMGFLTYVATLALGSRPRQRGYKVAGQAGDPGALHMLPGVQRM